MRQVLLIALYLTALLLALALGHALAVASAHAPDSPAAAGGQSRGRARRPRPCTDGAPAPAVTKAGDPPPCEPVGEPAWYLEIIPFDYLVVSDSRGNSDHIYEGQFTIKRVRDVTYNALCPHENCIMVTMPVGETYTFKFKSGGPAYLNLVRGVGNERPDTAVRYLDLDLPKGAWALLKVTARGAEDLRVDRDGDGLFETTVRPTASVRGRAARDTRGPSVEFSEKALDENTVLLTIRAADPSGLRGPVRYSFDGRSYAPYTGPLKVDVSRVSEVHVFADDRVGNRSGVYGYEPGRVSLRAPRRRPR